MAAGANGETFLAIPKKVPNKIGKNIDSYPSQLKFFNAPREKLAVVKFHEQGRGDDGLLNEIDFHANGLRKPAASKAVLLRKTLRSYKQGEILWLTLGSRGVATCVGSSSTMGRISHSASATISACSWQRPLHTCPMAYQTSHRVLRRTMKRGRLLATVTCTAAIFC